MAGWNISIDYWDEECVNHLLCQITEQLVVVAEYEGRIIGFSAMNDERLEPQLGPARVHLSHTVVDPLHRRSGIAEGIKRFLIAACEQRGMRRITTNHHRNNHAIINLSKKLGFVLYEETPKNRNHEPDHIFLELIIQPNVQEDRTD